MGLLITSNTAFSKLATLLAYLVLDVESITGQARLLMGLVMHSTRVTSVSGNACYHSVLFNISCLEHAFGLAPDQCNALTRLSGEFSPSFLCLERSYSRQGGVRRVPCRLHLRTSYHLFKSFRCASAHGTLLNFLELSFAHGCCEGNSHGEGQHATSCRHFWNSLKG